jgi:hypothetical protein
MRTILSALARFWRSHRIAVIAFAVLGTGVVFAGLHDIGIVMGIAAAMVLIIELTRRWRRIRNFIILFIGAVVGMIFLAFLDEGVVKPVVVFIGGQAALATAPFEIFNQVISLVMLFFGVACVLTGFFGTIVLAIWRLVQLVGRHDVTGDT